MYPEEGPLRRELYKKHMLFFAAGTGYRERLALAANRVGKTEGMGLFECVLHATGWYPAWWVGKRFDRAPRMWICGDSGKTLRDILQLKLLGPEGAYGTGLIPGETLEKTVRAQGVANAVEIIQVRHVSGGISTMTMKSYESGINAFMGTEMDVILLDEEPPADIYVECLIRTMTNQGIIMLTFTPLLGMSDVVMMFLVKGRVEDGPVAGSDSKYVVTATWDDVPHLDQRSKDQLWASIPPFQRDSRSRGIPQLGSGAIYPIAENEITCAPFSIPDDWPRWFGFDVGWNKTAAIWIAFNPEEKVLYAYSEYYRGQAEPEVHASAIRGRGSWINGFIDPASRGRSQKDGSKLIHEYTKMGLELKLADNAVEAGIFSVWSAMSAGKLKIFSSLQHTLGEYRLYRRDEDGRVVKKDDHLMDALRYAVFTGQKKAKTVNKGKPARRGRVIPRRFGSSNNGWMAS